MPVRQKIAPPRAAAGRGAKLSTRSAVNEIRHSTDELLNAFLTERRSQARTCSKELRKGNLARVKTVQTMMDGFGQMREESARKMSAELSRYMNELQASVVEARQDVNEHLRSIAAKRRRFAAVQGRFLSRRHQSHSRNRNAIMSDMADAREHATQGLQHDLKRFAETLHNDVGTFRQTLRQELGTEQAQPRRNAAGKASAPTARPAAGSPKPTKSAKPAVTLKGKAASVAKTPAKSANTKLRALKAAK